ncbi:MAG: SurA N-terminal domain-containing protein [Alphaproteobacteria bacterium]|nr:SurA N-terminal domain-containing protein [Alphaproteobacteria bacterium]
MLEYLRNAADKPVAKFLMGILIFSFVGWGVAEWVFGLTSSDTTLLQIDGEKISVNQYTAMRSNELSGMPRAEQKRLYTDPVAMADFQNGVVKRIASVKRLEHHARDLGYVVSDRFVANQIRSVPQFQANGKFSTATFDVVLRNSGLSESDVANDFRMRRLNEMVQTPVVTRANVPQFVADATYNSRNASRNLDMATVKLSEFRVGTPTEEELRAFYAQNPHRVAESRAVSYVMLPVQMDKPDEYEKNLKIAQAIEDDVIGGESFEAVAKKHNAKYVHYDNVAREKLPDDKLFDDALVSKIFNMDSGIESELIESKDGFVIVRVDSVVPEHDAEFDSVKKDLTAEWTNAERRKQAYVRANELLVGLNNGGKLPGAKSVTVSRTDGAPMPVLVAAFKNAVGENSIVESPDAFYVVHVAGEKLPAADAKKLAAIKQEVENMSARHIESDYNSYLERKYPVKINEKTYNRFVK